MAKKKAAKKPSESAYPYSYPRVYTLVLWRQQHLALQFS